MDKMTVYMTGIADQVEAAARRDDRDEIVAIIRRVRREKGRRLPRRSPPRCSITSMSASERGSATASEVTFREGRIVAGGPKADQEGCPSDPPRAVAGVPACGRARGHRNPCHSALSRGGAVSRRLSRAERRVQRFRDRQRTARTGRQLLDVAWDWLLAEMTALGKIAPEAEDRACRDLADQIESVAISTAQEVARHDHVPVR